jgi:hypothetical protein
MVVKYWFCGQERLVIFFSSFFVLYAFNNMHTFILFTTYNLFSDSISLQSFNFAERIFRSSLQSWLYFIINNHDKTLEKLCLVFTITNYVWEAQTLPKHLSNLEVLEISIGYYWPSLERRKENLLGRLKQSASQLGGDVKVNGSFRFVNIGWS